MDIKQIRAFVQVAECGSFSRAAVLLDTAQPALSRQVRALEVELGEVLLLRTGRGVSLTDAGRCLLEHGHAILQQFALAREDLGRQRGEPVGDITVGLLPSLTRQLCLPLIEAFEQQMPKARLSVMEGFSANIAEWLGSGRIDLGLIYMPDPQPHIEVQPLLHERLCLVGPAHTLRGRTSVHFDQLPMFGLIMPQHGQTLRKLIETQAILRQVQLKVAREVSSVPAVLDLVRAGYGYAVLTASAMRNHDHQDDAMQLASVPIEPPIPSTLCLIFSARKKTTPLLRKTSQILLQLVRADAGSTPAYAVAP